MLRKLRATNWLLMLRNSGFPCSGMLASHEPESPRAIALREKAVLYTNDTDFQRLSGLRLHNPLLD